MKKTVKAVCDVCGKDLVYEDGYYSCPVYLSQDSNIFHVDKDKNGVPKQEHTSYAGR